MSEPKENFASTQQSRFDDDNKVRSVTNYLLILSEDNIRLRSKVTKMAMRSVLHAQLQQDEGHLKLRMVLKRFKAKMSLLQLTRRRRELLLTVPLMM